MSLESVHAYGFREHVGTIEVRVDVLHSDVTFCDQFANLEETPVDVARAVARFSVARELDGAAVVDAENGRKLLREAHFGQKRADEEDLARARAGRDDLGLGSVVSLEEVP